MSQRRKSLAELAQEPGLDIDVPGLDDYNRTRVTARLVEIAPNPLNPREELGDLSDLVDSLKAVGQLQPCTVVTRAAYLTQHPEHETSLGDASFVAVTGARRRAAAALAGLETLDIIVKEDLAKSTETLAAAAIAENIERRNFGVLEEARAVEMLVQVCGSQTAAGDRLGRTKGWVSQRLALLKLAPEMKTELREGRLQVRDARRLAAVQPDQQFATWQAEQAERVYPVNASTGTDDASHGARPATPEPDGRQPHQAGSAESAPEVAVLRALRRTQADPEAIAAAVREHLSPHETRQLAKLLTTS